MAKADKYLPGAASVTVAGRDVPLRVRRSRRARRILLSVDPVDAFVSLVLPWNANLEDGLSLLQSQDRWLAKRLAAVPRRIPFCPGAEIPVFGEPHRISHHPGARRGVWVEDGVLNVSGGPEHLTRRVTDWLRALARRDFTARAQTMAARIDRPLGRITIRDTTTRWGSCTATGNLAFSWRLVLAPPDIIEYVVGHEVAHLRQLDHSRKFWAVVESLVGDVDEPRAWLRDHGQDLHRYG